MTEIQNHIPKTPKNLPELTTKQIENIRNDTQRLVNLESELRTKYLDSYHNINDKYPKFFNVVNNLVAIWEQLWKNNKNLSDENSRELIENYNLYASEFNNIINKNKLEDNKTKENTFNSLNTFANWEWNFEWINEELFSKEDKEELKKFTQDLWEEFFPDSNIDNFVKSITWQEKLEDYQKILLSPANWVENAVTWIASLFDKKTYIDLENSISTLNNLNSEDWDDLLRSLEFTYEQLSITDKIAPMISLIFSIAFLFWWIWKIWELAEKLNLSKKLANTIKYTHLAWSSTVMGNQSGKIALLWTMWWITLQIIKK